MKFQSYFTGLFGLLALSSLLISGCGKTEAPAPTSSAPPASTAPAPTASEAPAASAADAGSISGKVSFGGTAPAMKTVSMVKESSCAEAHKANPQKEESVVVNPNKTLRYVVVYIKSGAGSSAAPPAAATLDQRTCWYKPHVLAVMTGQTVNVTNSDPGVLHNIHFMPKLNTPLNFGQPGPAPGSPPPTRAVSFSKPEMIPVKCDVHAWMHAVVAVIGNPYFAVTDENGSFKISNVPPGTYTVEAWHEKLGTQDMQVVVGKKEAKTASFTFK